MQLTSEMFDCLHGWMVSVDRSIRELERIHGNAFEPPDHKTHAPADCPTTNAELNRRLAELEKKQQVFIEADTKAAKEWAAYMDRFEVRLSELRKLVADMGRRISALDDPFAPSTGHDHDGKNSDPVTAPTTMGIWCFCSQCNKYHQQIAHWEQFCGTDYWIIRETTCPLAAK